MKTKQLLLAFAVMLSLWGTGCKKKKLLPSPLNPGNQLAQITEQKDGQTTTYLVTLDGQRRLATIADAQSQLTFQYHYHHDQLMQVDHQNQGIIYQLKLQYGPIGTLAEAQFVVKSATGTEKVNPLNIHVKDGATEIGLSNNYLTLTVADGNLTSAEINQWYYKQKINFHYGKANPLTFGHQFPFPIAIIRNIFSPAEDQKLQAFLQLAAKAFIKNNLQQITSNNYRSTISQTLNHRQQVTAVTVNTEKLASETGNVIERNETILNYSYR